MNFPEEKCSSRGAHGRKPQEIAGGFEGSRIKNASQLSQELTFTAIPSVSLVHLGHTNRNVSVSHESQREIALV